jgi:pyrroline-5-carboxylate reductase
MKKIGFIGYGNMARILINSLLAAKAIKPEQVIVSTRTKSKLGSLKRKYPAITVAGDNRQVAEAGAYVFICVKPLQVKDVLLEVKDHINADACLISIAGALAINNIAKMFSGKIVRIIPSVTAQSESGFSLICYGKKISGNDRRFIERVFRGIGKIKIVRERQLSDGADLTSCMPAFMAKIFQEIIMAAVKRGEFSYQDAREMITQTLYGTAKLFCEKDILLETMMDNVATKGGITAQGIKVLNKKLPSVFKELFKTTADKRKKLGQLVDKQYE